MNENLIDPFLKTDSGKRATTLLTNRGLDVRSVFFMVYAQVTEVLPYLDDGRNYKIRDFFGDDNRWTRMTAGSHSAAGMCLAYMVRTNAAALVLHNTPSGKGPKKYRNPVVNHAARNRSVHIAIASVANPSINVGVQKCL